MLCRAVAYSYLDYGALAETGYITHSERPDLEEPQAYFADEGGEYWVPNPEWRDWVKKHVPGDIDELHEAAGRCCYQSFDRPREATRENRDYLRQSIIEQEHFSVLGHGHVTFYVDGVSRALLLELERHQQHMNLNFSVLSQRYVDQNRVGVVVPPLFTVDEAERLRDHATEALRRYDQIFHDMRSRGASVKEARGAARAFLPEATETKFFVTGSVRAWRDVVKKRATPAADEEIRMFALAVLRELDNLAPNSVQDLTEELL